jgi:hypothetical protein
MDRADRAEQGKAALARGAQQPCNTTPSDSDALGSIFGNSRSTTTVRFRTSELQLNGAAAHTFSLNFASQASSTTAGPKPVYSTGAWIRA